MSSITCVGAISSETSEKSLMVRWKSVPVCNLYRFCVRLATTSLTSNYFTYKNKSWRLQLSTYSSSNSFVGDSDLKLRILDANDQENIADFRDRNGAFMFEAKMEITIDDVNYYSGNSEDYKSINHEEIDNSIVFRNTSYYNNKYANIFVEFFKHEKGSKTESSLLTGDRFIELYQCLKESYLNKLYCDFTVTVKDRSFQVHKMILAARSTVFAAMMKNDMAEKKTNSVDITDCDPEAFHVFLLYLYSGEIEELSPENVTDVYVIADKYGVGNLKKDCVEYMKKNLSFDRFCDIIQLAAKFNELELLKASKEFFVKNSRKIVSTANFQLMMKENTTLSSELILLLTPGN